MSSRYLPAHVKGKRLQRSFEHLLQGGRKYDKAARLPARLQRAPPFVHVKDRIPLWNISHGDRVMVNSGSKKGSIGTVDYVDRPNNRVYLDETEFRRAKRVKTLKKNAIFNDPNFLSDSVVFAPVPIHYSNLSLIMQRSPEAEALAEKEREGIPGPLPEVVAKRVRATNPHYDWRQRRWVWKRLAENVAEVDESGTRYLDWEKSERYIPFIKPMKEAPKYPSPHDTTSLIASEATFVPSLNPNDEPPRELRIRAIEFGNEHSRAKRTQRWNDRKALSETKRAAELKPTGYRTSFRAKKSSTIPLITPKSSTPTDRFLEA